MQKHLDRTMEFLRDEAGASAAEYALLVSLIAAVIVVGITAFGINLNAYYDRIVFGLTF